MRAPPQPARADSTFPTATLRVNQTAVKLLSDTTVHAEQLHAAGIRAYDPGYAHTLAFTSAITFIDGPRGILRHRGYTIESLAAHASFLHVAYLLIYGQIPSDSQLLVWKNKIFRDVRIPPEVQSVLCAFPPHSHPMSVLVASFAAMTAAYPSLNPALQGNDLYASPIAREEAIRIVVSHVPPLAAAILRNARGQPPFFAMENMEHMSYAAVFLHCVNAGAALSRLEAQALDLLLILHADHEQNCSTATMRQVSSAGGDVFSSLSAATGALYGPLHGGATEAVVRMLERIGTVDAIEPFLQKVKNREEKLMGFGHRVYKNYDPRARIVRKIAYDIFEQLGKSEPLVEVATQLESAALADRYFSERKLYPNIDFYTGLIYKAMGFPTSFFPVLFALGRCVGWMAHWKEFLDDPDRRIARPHQRYVGHIGPRELTGDEKGGGFNRAKL